MKIKLESLGNRKQSFNTPGRFGYEINSLHITKLKYLSKSKPLNDLATLNRHQILPERSNICLAGRRNPLKISDYRDIVLKDPCPSARYPATAFNKLLRFQKTKGTRANECSS